MRPFPLFVNIEGCRCLVVGGGPVALRKARALGEAGAAVTVVAPAFDAGFDAGFATGGNALRGFTLVRRAFREEDAQGVALAVAATDDPEANAQVARVCRARGIPVNAVDDPANCSFFFPAVFRKGPITVAVSTGGASPVAAGLVRDRAARCIPDDLAEAVADLGARRDELKREWPDPNERRAKVEEMLAKWKDSGD